MRRFCLLGVLACVLAVGCGRTHVQNEGDYTFTSTEIIRDDCGLMPLGTQWPGTLTLSGDLTRIDTDVLASLQGQSANVGAVLLVGQYLLREESFTADGSAANVSAVANAQQCLVDLVNVHLEATSDDPAKFHGTLRVQYETQNDTRCVCQLWASYTAVHQ